MKTAGSFAFMFVLAAMLVGCEGAEKQRGPNVILPEGTVHDGWYFAAGDKVIINGTVNGDAYIGGGEVEVTGTINGDLIAGGGSVEVTGKITDDIRVAGGDVRIMGEVGKNVTVAGGNVAIRRSATVGGGVLGAGGKIDIAGVVKNNAMLSGGHIEVNGVIEKNVNVAGGELLIAPDATIGGNLFAVLPDAKHAAIPEGTVKGKITIEEEVTQESPKILGLTTFGFFLKLAWIGGLIVTGLGFFLLLPRRFAEYGAVVRKKIGMSLLWGLAGLLGVPIAAIVLLVTVVGIPVGLIVLALYGIVAYLSQLSLGLLAADLIFKTESMGRWAFFGAFVVGMGVFQVLTLIPFIGCLLEFGGLLLGMGAIILMTIGHTKSSHTAAV